jgi:hypothetical protein
MKKILFLLVLLIATAAVVWFVVNPGVYTVQPIGAFPEVDFVHFTERIFQF